VYYKEDNLEIVSTRHTSKPRLTGEHQAFVLGRKNMPDPVTKSTNKCVSKFNKMNYFDQKLDYVNPIDQKLEFQQKPKEFHIIMEF